MLSCWGCTQGGGALPGAVVSDGVGSTDVSSPAPESEVAEETTSLCEPDCLGKNCGDDGCGGACGVCSTGWECVQGICDLSRTGNPADLSD
ncbi:MAG: hypothetical protein VX938_10970, partial [Myxococcota bacterium]|nr:hypothetical protein [Myxococcota bacterium]